MNSREAERRDLTMSRLEGNLRRELEVAGISPTEALTVLTLVAGRIARDLVRDERHSAPETPSELPTALELVDGYAKALPRVITPDPIPELEPEPKPRKRITSKPLIQIYVDPPRLSPLAELALMAGYCGCRYHRLHAQCHVMCSGSGCRRRA